MVFPIGVQGKSPGMRSVGQVAQKLVIGPYSSNYTTMMYSRKSKRVFASLALYMQLAILYSDWRRAGVRLCKNG